MRKLKTYINFCIASLKEHTKQSRSVKLMKTAYLTLAFIIGTVLGTVLGVSLIDAIKPIYHLLLLSGWIITALVVVIIFLLILIDGARRLYERTAIELKADYESRAKRINRLSELYGRGTQLRLDFTMDEVPMKTLKVWSYDIERALISCYGSLGISKFAGERNYTLEVPDNDIDQTRWLTRTEDRLSQLIETEIPPPKQIDTSKLPAKAFMT